MMKEVKDEHKLSNLKIASMKRAFILFWHGLTGIFAGIANWFTVILGMRDDSKYGKFIRRVVGTCFAFLMLLLAFCAGWNVWDTICYRLNLSKHYDDSYYNSQYISRNVTYFSGEYGENDGYLLTNDGEKTITGIQWIAKPLGEDSLIFYSNGKKRGYFNMFTGEPVVKAKYSHAWIFSGGLAAVDDNGWIKFIDTKGEIVIDPKVPYFAATEGYVFHGEHCVMHNNLRNRVGLIDKQGKWALNAEYFNIYPVDSLWVVDNGKEQSVLTDKMQTVIPFIEGELYVCDNFIDAKMADHTMRRYNLQGELMEDFLISNIENITYKTDELYYGTSTTYDEEGNATGVTRDTEPSAIEKTANCKRYETGYGWYGLMSPEGKIITPPSYSSIEAIGYDLYLCKDSDNDGVLLNGKGERVR